VIFRDLDDHKNWPVKYEGALLSVLVYYIQ